MINIITIRNKPVAILLLDTENTATGANGNLRHDMGHTQFKRRKTAKWDLNHLLLILANAKI
jgi:hypothetical protein